ncbi:uncharacterized protein TRIADDRAFT_52540 [Trichoplax adhaerens]|uniref:G-protein coupled receptors family 1 profile domain-containing protein n=1 Tax=Trichoplax adhaerens TaxID=10228 RepID=B3RJ22_TRIAD|nr:hypothetical protein TRIADDRAFT_52540 [Trichoplax adhaerens]EDV29789.1 hypothetical protein TRIADDRAFT_52540 [Trichoplax adhaerens]|eukprot:XP_002108991.1 hypothetical protein TRIADDRAFT_52540 [Trichoplax adhaerens]
MTYSLFWVIHILRRSSILVCIVYIATPRLFRRSSGKFIFTLAVVDIFIGFMILLSTWDVMTLRILFFNNIHQDDAFIRVYFCPLLGSGYLKSSACTISIYLMALVSLERYYLIKKSTDYKIIFSGYRSKLMITFVMLWGCLLNLPSLYHTYHVVTDWPPCRWRPFPGGQLVDKSLQFVLFILQFLLPASTTLYCYVILIYRMRFSLVLSNNDDYKYHRLRRRVTTVSLVAAISIFICWMPNQLYVVIAHYDPFIYNYTLTTVTKTLVIFQCFLHPVLYTAANYYYHKPLVAVIRKLLCLSKKSMPSRYRQKGVSYAFNP